ncbi:MAG: hypothetical protein RL148_1034 [Planctomycetota bacterium]
MNAPVEPFLALRGFGLAHRSGSSGPHLLRDVTLTLPRGGFFLLCGTSGGGKSSLLRLLAGLVEAREVEPRVEGRIQLLGADLAGPYPHALRSRVAAVLQDEGLFDELTPRQNVELALRTAGRSAQLAVGFLAQAGLDPVPPSCDVLSGGMRKRLAVARALATEPEVLLCDEPTSGLDPTAARSVAQLLRDAHDRRAGCSTLVVTHDHDAFAGLHDGTLWLDGNRRSLELLPPGAALPTRAAAPRTAAPTEPPDDALQHGRNLLLQCAALLEAVQDSLFRIAPREPGLALRSVAQHALAAAPFTALGGAVVGGLAAWFALRNNPVEGAFSGAVLGGTGKVLVAVLLPLLAGLFFVARMAAGNAARLGAMVRTRQVDALRVLGLHPADRLLVPMVWGMTAALPVVTGVALVSGSLAAWFAARLALGLSFEGWIRHFTSQLAGSDLQAVLATSLVSGWLVAVSTWFLASGPKPSTRSVGDAVNAAIVTGMGLVLLVHGIATLRY